MSRHEWVSEMDEVTCSHCTKIEYSNASEVFSLLIATSHNEEFGVDDCGRVPTPKWGSSCGKGDLSGSTPSVPISFAGQERFTLRGIFNLNEKASDT